MASININMTATADHQTFSEALHMTPFVGVGSLVAPLVYTGAKVMSGTNLRTEKQSCQRVGSDSPWDAYFPRRSSISYQNVKLQGLPRKKHRCFCWKSIGLSRKSSFTCCLERISSPPHTVSRDVRCSVSHSWNTLSSFCLPQLECNPSLASIGTLG